MSIAKRILSTVGERSAQPVRKRDPDAAEPASGPQVIGGKGGENRQRPDVGRQSLRYVT
jgi:hypothetical protein